VEHIGARWDNLTSAQVSAAVFGLSIFCQQTAILYQQTALQKKVTGWKREDDDERRDVRANRMRRLAAQVHENASEALAFAKRSHAEAVAGNYRSARPLAIRSMQATRTAFDHSLREHDSDGHRPELSEFLEDRLAGRGLAALQAVTLYYAASTALRTLDDETPTLAGNVRSGRVRRRFFQADVEQAWAWLIEAQAQAERVDEKTLQAFEPNMRHRIRLRLVDATSHLHAVIGDAAQATRVYEDEERRLEKAGGLVGTEAATVRLLSNHAMALFGRGGDTTDEDAIATLCAAREKLRGAPASATAVRSTSSVMAASAAVIFDAGSSDTEPVPELPSRSAFRHAANELRRAKVNDRVRIFRCKKLTVPSMLLFVASLVPASDVDLVRLADEVVSEADAFLRDDTLDDNAWLKARGMIRVLDALFVALKTCPTDSAAAADKLAAGVIGVSAKLATVRAGPHETTRGGDFGAFARVVAPEPVFTTCPMGFTATKPPEIVFSELARARRMEKEARTFAAGDVPRRTCGNVLDADVRERIANIVMQADALV